jgi:hypothetical protein
LDALGKVTDVIRIAGFHGMDDPFYKERYGAKVWVVRGQRYVAGFDSKAPQTYSYYFKLGAYVQLAGASNTDGARIAFCSFEIQHAP